VYQWVEGYQANRYGNQQLHKYGLLNDEMDKLANQYGEETKHMNLPLQQIISDQEWSIWIANQNHRRYPQDSQTTHSGNRNEQMACST
jgi:hypothetical protein